MSAKVLTKTERAVAECVARSLNSYQISQHLDMSWHTVRTHRTNIRAKGFRDTAAITRYAVQQGWVVV